MADTVQTSMPQIEDKVPSPYKFLGYYDVEDADIFFGRDKEAEILFSDILVSRLVVLFAKTGTGKTSLINAGVRPRLHDLGYETFYLRVEDDPVVAARQDLIKADLLSPEDEGTIAQQMVQAVEKLKRPIVFFFDQFEEFFIRLKDLQKQYNFVSQIAELYRNRQSGVHIVFSMREEYFVDMDIFRDEIPIIFHHDSNLRLRWFDLLQAREVITRPAELSGVTVSEELVEKLIDDLAEDGRIEPPRLQIVCDTLWDKKEGDEITLDVYESQGGAEKILDQRLQQDIDKSLDDVLLEVFEKLLPQLKTERNTKTPRAVDQLVEVMQVDRVEFNRLVERLKDKRLLQTDQLYGLPYIEWPSDYMAARTDELHERVRVIKLNRRLQNAISKAGLLREQSQGATLYDIAITDEALDALFMSHADFEGFTDEYKTLKALNRISPLEMAEAQFLLNAALHHGRYMRYWFDEGTASNLDLIFVLEEHIDQGDLENVQTTNALTLLADINNSAALDLLNKAMDSPTLAGATVNVLGQMEGQGAVDLLKKALERKELAVQAIGVLRQNGSADSIKLLAEVVESGDQFALDAGLALSRITNVEAEQALDEAVVHQAKALFIRALEQGRDLLFWFDQAIQNNVNAWDIIETYIQNPQDWPKIAENVVRLLGLIHGDRAAKLLGKALTQDSLVQAAIATLAPMEDGTTVSLWETMLSKPYLERIANQALTKIAKSETADLAAREMAKKALSSDQSVLESQVLESKSISPTTRPRGDLDDGAWRLLLDQINSYKLTPIIGFSVGYPTSFRSDLAREWAHSVSYPTPNPNLAQVAQYMSVVSDPTSAKYDFLKFVNRFEDRNEIGRSELFDILASLPLPVYITTGFDNRLKEALHKNHKEPQVETHHWNSEQKKPSLLNTGYSPTPEEPLIYHLFGTYNEPLSLVLSENDHLDFMINVSNTGEYSLPPFIQANLARNSLLILGYDLPDWDFRVLNRGILSRISSPIRRRSYMTILSPGTENDDSGRTQQYLQEYIRSMGKTEIYWGTPKDFLVELYDEFQTVPTESDQQELSSDPQQNITTVRLYQKLNEFFTFNELVQLALDLNINVDVIQTTTKSDFCRNLVITMERQGRLDELRKLAAQNRPHVDWN